MNDNVTSEITEQRLEQAITKRIATGVQSVSVDGMSTSFQSLDSQLKALSTLRKMEAGRNPLGALKIFKVKNEG